MEEHVSQSIIFKNGIGHLPLTEGWGVYTTSVNATLFGPGGVWIRDVADDGIDFEKVMDPRLLKDNDDFANGVY